MVRFIDLTGQVYDIDLPKKEQSHVIAYYNTVTDRFVEFGGEQAFESFSDMRKYIESCKIECSVSLLSRLKNVTPKEFL